MIYELGVGKEFLSETVLAATYVTNRSPTAVLGDQTPAEMFFTQKPNIKKLRVF
jgi:hypothetical protein